MTSPPDRLTRGLAAMLHEPLAQAYAPLVNDPPGEWDDAFGNPKWFVPDMLATPTGTALRALVEAAEAWWAWDSGEVPEGQGAPIVDRLHEAAAAWLAITDEPTEEDRHG